ncbi:MAG: hypothetical protein JJT94_15530 [Bernardetiaceae bacterium]|nr:hypothetical protein [Bernardetiaceae bacterium]
MIDILPLYRFFTVLQRHPDCSLGIPDYETLLQVIGQDSSYWYDRQKLYRLCKLLWLKPKQNEYFFKTQFDALVMPITQKSETQKSETQLQKEQRPKQTPSLWEKITSFVKQSFQKKSQEPAPATQPKQTTEPKLPTTASSETLLYLNFEEGKATSGSETETIKYKKNFEFVADFVPLDRRSLIQQWRFLQEKQKGVRHKSQINIPKTVRTFAKQGFLVKPVSEKQLQNQVQLITLIDHRGSMLAFKNLALHIARTAQEMAGIKNHIFFFENIPNQYLRGTEQGQYYVYNNSSHSRSQNVERLLEKYPHTPLLIISDAGVARGNYNENRVTATEDFLAKCRQHTLKIAWINPMPEDRWDIPTAFLIRKHVQMFEANAQGLKKAIALWKGKKIYQS